MLAWLKARWQWLVVAAAIALAWFFGRGLTRREVENALALKKLTDVTQRHIDTQARANELKAESERLEAALTAEKQRAEKEQGDANRASHDAVVLDLKRRRILK